MKQLNEFDTLEDAKFYEDIRTRLVSGDMMRKFMIETGLYSYFKLHEQDPQQAAYDNLFGGEFNFIRGDDRSVESLFQFMINEAETPDRDAALTQLLSKCLDYANTVYFPYENTNQATFNRANGIYTQKEVVNFSKSRVILLNISSELPEPCLAYLYDIDEGFEDKYFGKAEPIKPGVIRYKITPPSNTKPNGKLFVRIPFDVDFTVEVI